MKKQKWWLIILILWMAMIFTATQLPFFKGENTAAVIHHAVASQNHSFIEKLNFIIRKATHFSVFGVLGLLFFKTLKTSRFAYILSWLLVTVYAATDEWHQSFMPGREASYKDVMLDSIGAAILLFIVYFFKKRRIKTE